MFNKVLIATDGSEHARKAVVIGSDIAARHASDVTLVHVLMRNEVARDLKRMAEVDHLLDSSDRELAGAFGQVPADRFLTQLTFPGQDLNASNRVLYALGERVLERAEATVRDAGVEKVTTHLVDGKVADKILEIAEAEEADLIVCGTRGLSNVTALLVGSVSHKLLHHAQVTCVTVR